MKEEDVRSCKQCKNLWKPIRAHHCSECNRCIYKMDHHCPWINNCVGVLNFKYFFLFVSYVCLGAIVGIVIMIASFVQLASSDITSRELEEYPAYFLAGIASFIASILFAFFTFEMGKDSLDIIDDNQTYVDSLKSLFGKPWSKKRVSLMWFGYDKLFWVVPTKPLIPLNYCEGLWTREQLIEASRMSNLVEEEHDPSGKYKRMAVESTKRDRKFFFAFLALILLVSSTGLINI